MWHKNTQIASLLGQSVGLPKDITYKRLHVGLHKNTNSYCSQHRKPVKTPLSCLICFQIINVIICCYLILMILTIYSTPILRPCWLDVGQILDGSCSHGNQCMEAGAILILYYIPILTGWKVQWTWGLMDPRPILFECDGTPFMAVWSIYDVNICPRCCTIPERIFRCTSIPNISLGFTTTSQNPNF